MSPQHLGTNNNKNLEFKSVSKTPCSFCQSIKVVKRGFRKTEDRGKIQTYFCKSCKKRFTPNIDGFFRMRNSPHKITINNSN